MKAAVQLWSFGLRDVLNIRRVEVGELRFFYLNGDSLIGSFLDHVGVLPDAVILHGRAASEQISFLP
jgi:hypothetical protein